ncbi:MFS transporter [Lentzea tibetensis]|uniref:MFS transporter n=1 Tax=Lentzea tibetensis TaxID=2591470 RepID=UPI0022A6F717|nr:MFS transporter [Lentzea tibetensis]
MEREVIALLPEPGPARTLAAAIFATTVGNGAFITASALYFTRVAGLSPLTMGAGLTAAGLAGLFAGVPGGHLADVHGPRRTTAVLTALTGLCVAGYLFVSSAWLFVVVAVAFAVCDRAAYAARQALIVSVVDGEKLVRTRAFLRSVTNIGVTVGAGFAAVALVVDTREAYLAVLALDAVSFVACAAVFLRLPDRAADAEAGERPRWYAVLRDRRYVALAATNMLLLLHAPLIEVVLPLWITRYTDAPRFLVAVLVVVNTTAVVLFQIRVSTRVDTLAKAAREVRTTGLLLAAACVLFATASYVSTPVTVLLLVVGAAVHAHGEMLQASGAWVVSYELAPRDATGQYLGLFNTGTAAAQQIAPAALILLTIQLGPPGWFVLAGIFVLAGLGMAVQVGRAKPRDARASARTF